MKLFLRKEFKKNEYRTPLIPIHCSKLLNKGFEIYIEKSDVRCFDDNEYVKNGCILSENIPENSIVIGLKDLDIFNDNFFRFKNIYFAHCFKNQVNSHKILEKFKKNNGVILDYEYIVDENNKRLIAFGYWAGFAGMFLGLLQYYNKINNFADINELQPLMDYNKIINIFEKINIQPKIAIIGYKGRCGKGAVNLLNKLNIKFTGVGRNDNYDLTKYEIIVNCIYLKPDSNFILIDNIDNFKALKIIVDISCDVNAKNNPIKINYCATTFEKPICKVGNIDVIAIDNLPSLLPKDSSTEFSEILVELLQDRNIWNKLEYLYFEKIKNI